MLKMVNKALSIL